MQNLRLSTYSDAGQKCFGKRQRVEEYIYDERQKVVSGDGEERAKPFLYTTSMQVSLRI